MKFLMTQADLERSVGQYIRKLIPGLDPQSVVTIDFKATRGQDGFTAEVDILSPEDLVVQQAVAEPVAAPKEPVRRASPAAAAPKAAVAQTETQQAAEPVAQVAQPEPVQEEEPAPFTSDENQAGTLREEGAGAAIEQPAAAPATAVVKRPLFGQRPIN